MADPLVSDDDFIRLWNDLGATGLTRHLKTTERAVYQRRRNIEQRYNIRLDAKRPDKAHNTPVYHPHSERATLQIQNGVVLVGSDLHAWPGPKPVAFRAFVQFCREMSPAAVIMNGDVIDGSTISRHPPLGWEKLPTLIEEIEVAQEWLQEVELAVPQATKLFWPCGNHDARFSVRLATVAPDYAKVHGTRLQDHFGERWTPCWSVWINETVVCKHRYRGGIHAAHTNTVNSGMTTITGHLHSLKVTPWSDYTGTRFGVDTGCLADPYGPQFRYTEDNPRNHRAGFVVLTFVDGRLMWPEVVAAVDETHVEFRGELLEVPMTDTDDADDIPDYAIGGGVTDKKKRKPPRTMKPPSASRRRPVSVMSARSKSKPTRKDR